MFVLNVSAHGYILDINLIIIISLLYNYLILALRQHVTIFDLSTTDLGKQRQYLVRAWSILNSISSTVVRPGELPGKIKVVTV